MTWNQIVIELASLEWWQIGLAGSGGIFTIVFLVMLMFDTAIE